MVSSREYIIERLKGKKKTIDEFNYDMLDAPPIAYFFQPYEINKLYRIAASLKLQSNPQERYRLIDEIMKGKGMLKLGSGTNRLVYLHPEFPDILFKIAADHVALGDNPAEYKNQFLLKPFVAKTFEISPCGTVAISERVNPIQSREEFISVADDIFEVITEFLIGKYVLADIGEKFFMNWGVRKGFGPVLLDYPYLYELDGDKLYCCRPEPTSPKGVCDGLIDYDAGFNKLVCTKCGAIYKAAELKKHIEEKIIKSGGIGKMKITIKGSKGTKVIGENNTPFREQEAVLVHRTMNVTTSKTSPFPPAKTNEELGISVTPAKEEKKEFKKFSDKTVNGVTESDKKYENPLVEDKEFGDKCRKEAEERKTKKPPMQVFDELAQQLLDAADNIAVDMAADDALLRAIDKLYAKVTSKEKILKTDFADDIFADIPVTSTVKSADRVGDDLEVTFSIEIGSRMFTINNEKFIINGVFESDDEEEETAEAEEVTAEEEVEDHNSMDNVGSICFYEGYIVNLKDVDPTMDQKSVLVLSNDGGDTLVTDVDGSSIVVNKIDDRSVNSLSIVSKKWLKAVTKNAEEPAEESDADDVKVEEVSEETVKVEV